MKMTLRFWQTLNCWKILFMLKQIHLQTARTPPVITHTLAEQCMGNIKQHLHVSMTNINNSYVYQHLASAAVEAAEKPLWVKQECVCVRESVCVCVCVCDGDTIKHLLFTQTQITVQCLQGLSCCRCGGWWRNTNAFTVVCWQKRHRGGCDSARRPARSYALTLTHRCIRAGSHVSTALIFTYGVVIGSYFFYLALCRSCCQRHNGHFPGRNVNELQTEWCVICVL